MRNYLTSLRKALPPGALATSDRGRQHRITGIVQSDWGLFCAYVSDTSTGRVPSLVAALKLVRGRPFAWAESGQDGAYGWALAGLASEMERVVEKAAHELVGLCLESGDLETAKFTVDAGLRATSYSEALEKDALRIAVARGGKAGLRKAMVEARARLGDDTARIETFARELGWSGW